jgi:hypothetical protein
MSPARPGGLRWRDHLAGGLLIVSPADARVLRRAAAGSLVRYAGLPAPAAGWP